MTTATSTPTETVPSEAQNPSLDRAEFATPVHGNIKLSSVLLIIFGFVLACAVIGSLAARKPTPVATPQAPAASQSSATH